MNFSQTFFPKILLISIAKKHRKDLFIIFLFLPGFHKLYLGLLRQNILNHPIFIILNSFVTETVIYRNQFNDLRSKSIDWFLYDNGLHHERVKYSLEYKVTINHRKVMRIDPELFGIIHSVGTQNFPKKTNISYP